MTKVILPAVLTATFVFLLAPIIVVVLASFNGVGVLSFPPQAFTTRWYSWWECRVRSGWRGGASVAAMRSTRSACPR